MFAPPPKMNRVTIYSINAKNLSDFYSELGMLFYKEIEVLNNNRTIKYSYVYGDFTFEIRQVKKSSETTKNIKLTFLIDEIDGYSETFKKYKIEIIKDSWVSENYQYISIKDIDGNLIELMTKK